MEGAVVYSENERNKNNWSRNKITNNLVTRLAQSFWGIIV
jgi:hypothetical protein